MTDTTLPQDQLPPLPPTNDGVPPVPPTELPAVKMPTPPTSLSSTPTTPVVASTNLPPTPVEQPQPLPPSTDEPVIAPPTPAEIPHEASFPGQPIPEAEQEKLEEKAKVIIASDGGLPPSKATKSKIMQSVLGVLALLLVGAGVFFGQQLVTSEGVGDIRQQASLDDVAWCTTGSESTCGKPCPDNYPFEKDGYCHKIDPTNGTPSTCPDWAPVKTQGCITYTDPTNPDSKVVCMELSNGALYCGGLREGDVCEPILGGGGDWCAIIGANGSTTTANCADVGLNRCECNNGVWVIGSGSCYSMCGATGTGNTCTKNCDDNPPSETPPPEVHRECVNDSCAYVAGGGADTCTTVEDCDSPPGETLTCTAISSSPVHPTLGDSASFTCTGTTSPGTIDHFNFEYRIGLEAYAPLAETAVGSGQSVPLLISNPGTYSVRCRACKSADDTNCSPWQAL